MRIVTRAEWKARPPRSALSSTPISARTATCVHHDGATPITIKSFEQACQRVRDDQAYHQNGNGWSDIGYNYLVISAPGVAGVDGLIFEARGRDKIGAHCLDHNVPWVGIQVAIGGGQTPSPAALASVRWLHDTLEQSATHSLAKKVHSDGFATACPDPKLRAWVKAGMPIAHSPSPSQGDDMTPAESALLTSISTRLTAQSEIDTGQRAVDAGRYKVYSNWNAQQISRATAQDARIAALSAAVAALASTSGADGAAVLAAVTAAVQGSLADLSITLSTEV